MDGLALDVEGPMGGVELDTNAVEVLGDLAKLDDQDEARSGGASSLIFRARPQERLLVLTHDGPGVGAENEVEAEINLHCAVNIGHNSCHSPSRCLIIGCSELNLSDTKGSYTMI